MVDYKFIYYHYTPSIGAAIVFIVLFLLGTFAHLYYVFKLKARYFIPFVIGCISSSRMLWLCRTCMVSLRSHEALTLYHTKYPYSGRPCALRSKHVHGPRSYYSPTSRRRHLHHQAQVANQDLRCRDVFSFLVQAAGAGLMAQRTLSSYNTGSNIIIVGLVIQIVIFGFFIVLHGVQPSSQEEPYSHGL